MIDSAVPASATPPTPRLGGRSTGGQPLNRDSEPVEIDGGSFEDLLDFVWGTINPLQHIPVVSTLYREITGDTLPESARVAGGFLFGGPLGLLSGAVDAVIKQASGHDIGEHVAAVFDLGPASSGPAAAAYARASDQGRQEAGSPAIDNLA